MDGELRVKELHRAIFFIGAGNDGQFVAQNLKPIAPLLPNKAALPGRGRDQAIDRRSVSGSPRDNRQDGSVRKYDAVEPNIWNMKRREVPAKPSRDATAMVRMQSHNRAMDDGFGWQNNAVVNINGIDELTVDVLPHPHGEMILNLNWQWSSGWNCDALRRTSGRNTCQHAQIQKPKDHALLCTLKMKTT
jgi:hypothetical protein